MRSRERSGTPSQSLTPTCPPDPPDEADVAVINVLVGIGATVATLVVGWAVVSGTRRTRRSRRLRVEERRNARVWREREKAQQQEAAAARDPDQVLIRARQGADTLVAEAKSAAAGIAERAERTAGEVIGAAEQEATEIIAAAELTRARFEEEMNRERRAVADQRAELATLLVNLLAEIQRTTGIEAANDRSRSDARDARTGMVGSAE